MDKKFDNDFGTFLLSRGSGENNRSLQAWSSADSYLLSSIKRYDLKKSDNILVVNDSFGALTVSLCSNFDVYHMSDSLCAAKECIHNLERNGFDDTSVSFLNPDDQFPSDLSLIVMINPKSLNYLEFLLQRFSSELPSGVPILAADMVRNIRSSTVTMYEHYLKGVKTSLAVKKARLITGETGGIVELLNHFPVEYRPLDESFSVVNYPNLFAFGRLDPGTAFFLSNFPYVKNSRSVIDLACGDGVLALKAATLWPEAEILCTDESWLAVKSSRESFKRNNITARVEFLVADVLEETGVNLVDVVLCNPPFHSNHSLSTATAIKMFQQSANVLKSGGELFVIANRHLGYENALSKIFAKVQIIKSNKKFSIIRAVKG